MTKKLREYMRDSCSELSQLCPPHPQLPPFSSVGAGPDTPSLAVFALPFTEPLLPEGPVPGAGAAGMSQSALSSGSVSW